MSDKFRFIAHTADTGLVATGKNLAEAFANAAAGMFSIIVDRRTVKERETRVIELQEADGEALLFAWLNELIYLFDVDHLLFRRFTLEEFDEKNLKARGYGEKYDPARHELKIGIKSATYHMLAVDREKNRVQVIFDI